MKTLKKASILTLVSTLAIAFAVGCGSKKDGASPTPAPASSSVGGQSPTENTPDAKKTEDANAISSSMTGPAPSPGAGAGSLSYWEIQDGCSTQKQTFESKEALCKGLQDRALNKNCALELRMKRFTQAGCIGAFTEFAGAATADANEPSPVKCVGFIRGSSGEKKIERIIPWDRKNYQKIILSTFSDLKDAGEYSVNLIPLEDPAKVGAMKIVGFFIDNNKNQVADGPLNSMVRLQHKDSSLNSREVNIECGLERPDLKVPTYAEEEKLEMTCSGFSGLFEGKKDLLSSHFYWDRKNPLNQEVPAFKDGKETNSNLRVEMTVHGETKRPSMTIQSINPIDGHVEMVGHVQGNVVLNVRYVSAWDNREVELTCLPTKLFRESLEARTKKENDDSK
jgi:hypothetical protein